MSAERIWELVARKLAGEASGEELQELEQLLRAHPDLHFSVQTLTDLWQHQATQPATGAGDEQSWEAHLARMQAQGIDLHEAAAEKEAIPMWPAVEPMPRKNRRTGYRLLVAATIVLITGSLIYFLRPADAANQPVADRSSAPPSAPLNNEITTGYGVRTTRQLPDGSRVWLNAGSTLVLSAAYGEAAREVTLTGEAFFDVVKNADKPFIIHTAAVDIKVLGTRFNVKSYPADKTTETSLLRGSVEVVVKNRPDEKYVLKPNEKLVVLNEEFTNDATQHTSNPNRSPKENIIAIKNLTYAQDDTSAIEAAWVHNKLAVKDEPFIELARKMERWYDVRFEFRNKKLEEIFITGSFENETLEQALEALRFSVSFNYEIKDKTVIAY